MRVLSTRDDTWRFPSGQTVQLCVVEELHPTDNSSTQSSVVFLGFSLCKHHFDMFKGFLLENITKGYSTDYTIKIFLTTALKGHIDGKPDTGTADAGDDRHSNDPI